MQARILAEKSTRKGAVITLFAKVNDIVTVIADHDNVLIVANSKGERFSVQTTDVEIINQCNE